MKKLTINLKMQMLILLCLVFSAFSPVDLLLEHTLYMQKKLSDHYDTSQDGISVKRFELNLTGTGFCRYKRYFSNGKTEYFSFSLSKFKSLDYLGNVRRGKICLRTLNDDVIVQTYKDRGGDVDSMASCVFIPLKDIEPEELNDFNERFLKMNELLIARK